MSGPSDFEVEITQVTQSHHNLIKLRRQSRRRKEYQKNRDTLMRITSLPSQPPTNNSLIDAFYGGSLNIFEHRQ
ncbi:13101_t:CDS:2 [Funneliformis mosseae]|uniref:13101_t:CDS:1 n=1 Tax=Funneliformis mosseae TaxID=27381 RepID=A0A9N8VKB9_FUNMO|nr:13101_t:CDS:2 [Funneliformis mosseae]